MGHVAALRPLAWPSYGTVKVQAERPLCLPVTARDRMLLLLLLLRALVCTTSCFPSRPDCSIP